MTNQQRGCETQSYEGVHIPMAERKPPNKYAQTYAQGISLGQWFGLVQMVDIRIPEFTKYRIRQ